MDAAQKEETATAAAGTDTAPDLGTAQIPAFEAVAIPQIMSQVEVTAHILEAVQSGTVAAEKNFLENNAAVKNALLEKAEKDKKDKNAERTANGVERLVELQEEEKEDVIY